MEHASSSEDLCFDYIAAWKDLLKEIVQEGRYRVFRAFEKQTVSPPRALWDDQGNIREIVLWSSNDYLGLSFEKGAIEAMCAQARTGGLGAGGTRNISGTHPLHRHLEEVVATWYRKEAGLIFTSGYVANETALGTLGRLLPGCVFFSDAANHASLIAGIRTSGAFKHIFQHNDVQHLEALLCKTPRDVPKIIVCESVYSMDGDKAPLREICTLAEYHGALVYLDEVHAVGLYGARGSGIAEEEGLLDRVHLIQGTFSKAIGTIGGYLTGNREIIDVIRSCAPGFIFTTALPPPLLAATLQNIQLIQETPDIRSAFWQVVHATKKSLLAHGIPVYANDTHILPLMVEGGAARCQVMGDKLLREHGLSLQPINYPTVPRGKERFRLTPSRFHTKTMVEDLMTGLRDVF